MGVGAQWQQRRQVDQVAADVPYCVSDDAGGGDDLELLAFAQGYR